MTVFGDARADMAAKLVAAGVPATTDPGFTPPAVLVDLASAVSPGSGALGVWPGTVPVKLVAAPPGDAAAAAWLETQLQAVLSTLGPAPFTPATYTGPGDQSWPMYELSYPVKFPNPNC